MSRKNSAAFFLKLSDHGSVLRVLGDPEISAFEWSLFTIQIAPLKRKQGLSLLTGCASKVRGCSSAFGEAGSLPLDH